MAFIITIASLTLLASFLCSLFEATLYSITASQMQLLKQKGVKNADLLERLRDDVEEPIAAILTVNTIAHTVGSAWCGALVADRFGGEHPNAVAIFAAVFTFLVLGATEIIPKSLGVRYATALGPLVARPIQWMVWVSYPVARPSKAVMRMLTGGGGHEGPTEDEVVLFSQLAQNSGGLRAQEHRWVEGALRLDKVTAAELRTPRTVVFALDADMTVAEATKDPEAWVHSRVPISEEGKLLQMVGLVHRRDILAAALGGEGDKPLRAYARPLDSVEKSRPAHELLDRFIAERRHMFAVVGEYGGFDGVVTLEDVLEQLLGAEIVDETDEHDDMQAEALRRASDAG